MLVRHQHYETFWGSGVWNPNKPLLATGIPGWTVYIPTCYTTCFLQFHSLQPNYTCSSLWKFLYGSNKKKHSNFHPRHRHRHSKPVGALKTSTLQRVACFVAQSARPGIKIPSHSWFFAPVSDLFRVELFFERRGRCLLNRGPFIRQIHQQGVAPFSWSGSKSHQKSTLVFHRFFFCELEGFHKHLDVTQYQPYYVYLEPICPLFLGLNPPKEGTFQSKQVSFWAPGTCKLRLNQYHSGKTGASLVFRSTDHCGVRRVFAACLPWVTPESEQPTHQVTMVAPEKRASMGSFCANEVLDKTKLASACCFRWVLSLGFRID